MAAKKKPKKRSTTLQGSDRATKLTVGILQALSGLKATTEVCEDLGISMGRYYQLESQALQGMLQALEPKKRGKQSSPKSTIESLEREKQRLAREVRRYQSLLRASHRGLAVPAPRGHKAATKKRARRGERGKTVLKTLMNRLDASDEHGTQSQEDR